MKPELAGELCDRLDQSLRGSETNLTQLAHLIVVVLRKQAWKTRRIRTGQVVECASFLELLTAKPLRGFGEDPKRVEALLKDDAEALRMFREHTTGPQGQHLHDNVMRKAGQGNSRAYTLTRLHAEAPALYQRVVNGELSAHAAALTAGFRSKKTPLEELHAWWKKASAEEQAAFRKDIA